MTMMTDDRIINAIVDAFPGLRGLDPDIVMEAIADEELFLDVFRGHPLELGELCTVEGLPAMFPRKPHEIMGVACLPGIRELFADLTTLQVTKAVVLAPRGGGKSAIIGVVVAVTWTANGWDWFVIGGSEMQASKVYRYFSENLDRFRPFLPSDFIKRSTMQETRSRDFGQVAIGAASQKRVRSPHMGSKNKPGGLIVDEEMEAEADIVTAAKFTINTANPPIIVRTSTAHKAEGPFLDCVDGAPENGYKLYQWDAFDIAQQCPYDCDECPVEDFAHDVYEYDELNDKQHLIHKAYCGGKAQFAEGWIPIDSLVSLWNEVPRSVFECEAMGWRIEDTKYMIPNRKGLIACFEHRMPEIATDATRLFAIDWGFSGETALGLFLSDANGNPVLVWYKYYTRCTIDRIAADMVKLREQHNVNDVFADASHPFNNAQLRSAYGFSVRPVMFDRYKILGVQRINAHVDNGTLIIPIQDLDSRTRKALGHVLKQLQGWRKRQGKIVKRDDHGPDMIICAMLKYQPHSEVGVAAVDYDDDGVDEYELDFGNLTEEEIDVLLAGECLMDGASWGVAGDAVGGTGEAYLASDDDAAMIMTRGWHGNQIGAV